MTLSGALLSRNFEKDEFLNQWAEVAATRLLVRESARAEPANSFVVNRRSAIGQAAIHSVEVGHSTASILSETGCSEPVAVWRPALPGGAENLSAPKSRHAQHGIHYLRRR